MLVFLIIFPNFDVFPPPGFPAWPPASLLGSENSSWGAAAPLPPSPIGVPVGSVGLGLCWVWVWGGAGTGETEARGRRDPVLQLLAAGSRSLLRGLALPRSFLFSFHFGAQRLTCVQPRGLVVAPLQKS